MSLEILSVILSALTTLAGAIVTYYLERRQKRRSGHKAALPNYQERMKQLTADLARASSEVDKTLEEMETVSRSREEALVTLEARLSELSKSEEDMQRRIEALKNVPLPAVEHFLEMTERGERRSAARDYILFGAGVMVSTVITIVLKLVFGI